MNYKIKATTARPYYMTRENKRRASPPPLTSRAPSGTERFDFPDARSSSGAAASGTGGASASAEAFPLATPPPREREAPLAWPPRSLLSLRPPVGPHVYAARRKESASGEH